MTDGTMNPIKFVYDKRKLLMPVHYLENIEITVGLENSDAHATVIIDSLGLRFKSRPCRPVGIDAKPYITVLYSGGAISIPPAKLQCFTVQVRPDLLFARETNCFDIAGTYRLCTNEKIGDPQPLTDPGWFVIIKSAPPLYGKAFISYKEPEDQKLADLLSEFAKDAGFEPYMAPPDVRPGSLIWPEKILPAIKGSKFMFVIWTRNTLKGRGVKKEIKIARKHRIGIVPLLEGKASNPRLFGRGVEYTPFDADDPALAFADVVKAKRP